MPCLTAVITQPAHGLLKINCLTILTKICFIHMKNKFNNLTSKEWLPFQKSWFRYEDDNKLYDANIRFFTKASEGNVNIFYAGANHQIAKNICTRNDIAIKSFKNLGGHSIQYAIFDLRDEVTENTTLQDYEKIRERVINDILSLMEHIEHRRFITIFIRNVQKNEAYYPFAWDLAKHISSILSIKDEKIACIENTDENKAGRVFSPKGDTFYCLHFRKDEKSNGTYEKPELRLFENNQQQVDQMQFSNEIPAWFILKPRSRKKNEILHPAKYPEELVEQFVSEFTRENANVFDPMSGTGSTQMGALKQKRNGYGTELSEFFAQIANERCKEYIAPTQKELFDEAKNQEYKILIKDARLIENDDLPAIDYVITSPPYWDMLNMKGAENQAKRKKKGLQTNYSEDKEDLGNIADYQQFIEELTDIYFNIADLMKPGAFITIIVKNIKKKGQNYPFAWDLANSLQKKLILLPEVFWLQDDISIAPYGYGNTWVSNTFHQYCLTFQKPFS
jgi:DNA modification methylase